MKSLNQIAEILKSKDCIYIITHKNPDGDTLGSACALCEALRKMGKKSEVIVDGNVSSKYTFLEKYRCTHSFEPEYTLGVDLADIKLAPEEADEYLDKIDMSIDHHISNSGYANVTFVDVSAAAAAEVVYSVIKELNVDITRDIAEYIYIGLATDTGCFKYSNVTSRTHRIAAELIERNIDVGEINRHLFDTQSKSLIKLKGMIYDTLEYFYDGRCATVHVTEDMLKKVGINDSELEGIASIPRAIEGVKIGITIREKKEGICRVSVRTVDGISARGICSAYRGGGHECTGGCTINGEIWSVKESLIKTIGNELGW